MASEASAASTSSPHSTTTPILPQQRSHQPNGTSRTTRRPSRPDRPNNEQLSERRSSMISLDSFRDSTSDMWLPRPKLNYPSSSSNNNEDGVSDDKSSNWASAPLAFALLPAIGGMVFKNGSAVVSDILLLGLAAVFLNWSVRLPWDWYKSAQELGTQDAMHDGIRDYEDGDISDSGPDESTHTYPSGDLNYEVPTEEDVKNGIFATPTPRPRSARKLRQISTYEASRKELYRHELLALLCCFLFPLLGAYLLHTIRDSLSRPSEGLVSNYNLTIFLLAAELRPMSHLVKLVQARTLHLQRIVKDNPYRSVDEQQSRDIEGIRGRIEELESRLTAAPLQTPGSLPGDPPSKQNGAALDDKQLAVIVSSVRRQLQPELDALNRAVRRYEKRAALQAMQTESRLLELEARLGDAISLAAAAAKSSNSKSAVATVAEWVGKGVILPWQIAGSIIQMPFGVIKSILRFVGIGGSKVNPGRDVNVRVDVGRRKSSMKGGRETERVMKASASTVRQGREGR